MEQTLEQTVSIVVPTVDGAGGSAGEHRRTAYPHR